MFQFDLAPDHTSIVHLLLDEHVLLDHFIDIVADDAIVVIKLFLVGLARLTIEDHVHHVLARAAAVVEGQRDGQEDTEEANDGENQVQLLVLL